MQKHNKKVTAEQIVGLTAIVKKGMEDYYFSDGDAYNKRIFYWRRIENKVENYAYASDMRPGTAIAYSQKIIEEIHKKMGYIDITDFRLPKKHRKVMKKALKAMKDGILY